MSNPSIAGLVFDKSDKDAVFALLEEALQVRRLVGQSCEPGFLHRNSSLVEGAIYDWHASLVQTYTSRGKVLPKDYSIASSKEYLLSL